MKNKNIIGFFVLAFVLMFSAFYVFADDPEDHGTINLYYSIEEGLRVGGEAPDEADTAKIRACTTDIENTECNANDDYIIAEVPVTTGGDNGNWYNSQNDVSSWDPVKWNIYVTFYDGGEWMAGYNVFDLFDDLYILYLQDQIDELSEGLAILESDVEENTEDIWDLFDRLYSLEDELEELQDQVDDIEGDVTDLQDALDALEDRVTDLEDVIGAMNHGVINLRYRSNLEVLEVWGEAPEGASGVTLTIRRVSDYDDVVYSDTDSIINDGINDNRYAFNLATGDEVDVSGFDPESYNVQVEFGGMQGSYKVSQIFTNLELEDIQDSISALYLADEDLWIAVDDNTNEILLIWDVVSGLWTDSSDQWEDINDLWQQNWAQWSQIGWLWHANFMQWQAIGELDEKVSMLEELLNEMNHGTINLRYNANRNLLHVWGEAPEGATQANLKIRKVIGGPIVYTDSIPVMDLPNNGNFYGFMDGFDNSVDVTGWDQESYNVRVTFNGVGPSYQVSQIFTNLELEGIQESISYLYDEVEDLWIAVDDNTDNIEWLWDDSEEQWDAIDDIEQVNEQQWRAIQALWRDSSYQWMHINWLWRDSSMQWRAIRGLDHRLDMLRHRLNEMNHGTINLYHYENYGYKFLTVWGEAPDGSNMAHVEVYGIDQLPFIDTPVDERHNLVINNNVYFALFSIDGWDSEKYNIYAYFTPARNGCTLLTCSVGALFDDLFLQQIGDDLYGSGEACMELGIPINPYDNEYFNIPRADTLLWLAQEAAYYSDGEVTFGDICTAYGELGDFTYFLDWVYFEPETMYYITEFLKCLGYDDETHLNTFINLCQEWEITNIEEEIDELKERVGDNEDDIEELKIEVNELRDRLNAFMEATGENFEEVWIDLEHVWSLIYGFEHVDEKVWTTYYMSASITRPIVYSVIPREYGLYTISLVEGGEEQQILGEGGISQLLEECVWLNAGVKNNIISYVTVPSPGEYNVQLQAVPGCEMGIDIAPPEEQGEIITSNEFVIQLNDMKDEVPEANLEIVLPEPNFPPEEIELFGPYEESDPEIFWTRSDAEFTLAAVGEAVAGLASNECHVFGRAVTKEELGISTIWDDDIYMELANVEGYYVEASETLSPEDEKLKGVLGYGSEGIYKVKVEMFPQAGGPWPSDIVLIGVDDTSPAINSYYPGEEDIISGPFTFSVDITDDMSGVRNVDLSLILKGEEEPEWTTAATYTYDEETETGRWEVDLETSQIPDGSYNFKVEAWDYANNPYYMMDEEGQLILDGEGKPIPYLFIDPIVDNTPPELSEPQIGATVCIENHNLALSVTAIDAMSGVDGSAVYAEVTGPDGTGINGEVVTLSKGADDRYSGTFTNENIVDGSYDVVFYASDNGGNQGSVSAVQEVEVVICPPGPEARSENSGNNGGSNSKKLTSDSEEEEETGSCNENWVCDDWSECDSSEKQTRDCADTNNCGSIRDKPAVVKSCTYFEEGSAEVGTEVEGGTEEGADMGGVTGMFTGMAMLENLAKGNKTVIAIFVLIGLGVIGYLTKDFWFKK